MSINNHPSPKIDTHISIYDAETISPKIDTHISIYDAEIMPNNHLVAFLGFAALPATGLLPPLLATGTATFAYSFFYSTANLAASFFYSGAGLLARFF